MKVTQNEIIIRGKIKSIHTELDKNLKRIAINSAKGIKQKR